MVRTRVRTREYGHTMVRVGVYHGTIPWYVRVQYGPYHYGKRGTYTYTYNTGTREPGTTGQRPLASSSVPVAPECLYFKSFLR